MRQWIDLSQQFYEGMPGSPSPDVPPIGFPRLRSIGPTASTNLTGFNFYSHCGTHMDAPLHFVAHGESIDQVALPRCVGTGVILDFSSKRPSEQITRANLESAQPEVAASDIVLICTGWWRKYGTPDYHDHPYLSADAAHWLVDRSVKMLGIDTPSPDQPFRTRIAGFDWPVHRPLLENGVLIVENVGNLGSVAGRRVEIVAFPIAIRGSDGAPVRIVAQVDAD